MQLAMAMYFLVGTSLLHGEIFRLECDMLFLTSDVPWPKATSAIFLVSFPSSRWSFVLDEVRGALGGCWLTSGHEMEGLRTFMFMVDVAGSYDLASGKPISALCQGCGIGKDYIGLYASRGGN
ncbi:hypothetical protein C8F01DRAFT_1125591 [Mycena amicta]|nr:hypothetical protein C8F01DRAFT_1125591 [Mycena amicta]